MFHRFRSSTGAGLLLLALLLPGRAVAAGAGKKVALIGAVGLGATYLATVIVGSLGPATSSSSYFIPVVGPFMQASRVSAPYDGLNITSGVLQTGFLVTLAVGLTMMATSRGGGALSFGMAPVITPEQQGALVSLNF